MSLVITSESTSRASRQLPKMLCDEPNLVDISRYLRPLIAKNIENTEIQSLDISNAWKLFLWEFMQICLCITSDQGFPGIGYPRVCSLLESLIDDNVQILLREHHGAQGKYHEDEIYVLYPKLRALIDLASSSATETLDLSTLLHLPGTTDRSWDAAQIITDFNEANLPRSNTAIYGDHSNPVSRSQRKTDSSEQIMTAELEKAGKSRQNLSLILDAMGESICASCRGHIARLQLRYPDKSSEVDADFNHRAFVSCCHIQDKWQDISCTRPSRHLDTRAKDIKNFCKILGNAYDKERTLKLTFRESKLMHEPKAGQIVDIPHVWPTLSLEDLLASGQELSPIHRLMLALNMSHALLRMYPTGTPGFNWEWTARDIYFLVNTSNKTICEAYNPYVAYPLSPLQRQGDSKTDAQLRGSIKFPILVFFAQILLEIALGRPLGPFNRRPDVALLELVDKNDTDLAGNVGPIYRDAIVHCLDSNIDEDDDSDDDEENNGQGRRDEDAQCRKALYEVVQALEDARIKGFPVRKNARKDPRTDPNHPFQLDLAKVTEFQIATRLQHDVPLSKASSKPLSTVPAPDEIKIKGFGSRSQLFDDRKLTIGAGDSRVRMAADFLDDAENFYDQHIMNLPSDRKIRVAILDTGVKRNDSYFRTVRRSRKERDHPIKAVKSFVGEPEEDAIGHGTNVAALVLKMAPEADLYIAKIAHDQETDGADHIAQAIEWAQGHEVDIINMSFGLDKSHGGIKRAISKAEINGVIILAAASNYGGNKPRAFPASMDKVICIHASDGNGYPSGMDPFPQTHDPNLTTLGVAIRSIVDPNVYLSGTSYSCPIAAGMAANILHFIQHLHCSKRITQDLRDEAFSREGMRSLLKTMAEFNGNYNYIAPWCRLWMPSSTVDDVARRIKDALERGI